jgi:hypothetical protein
LIWDKFQSDNPSIHSAKLKKSPRFIETEEKDYSPVFEYAAQIGLDLKQFDYVNTMKVENIDFF